MWSNHQKPAWIQYDWIILFFCSGCSIKPKERLHHKDKDTCSICHRCVGACLKVCFLNFIPSTNKCRQMNHTLLNFSFSTMQCCTLDCQITFHPSCARDAGLYMNTKRLGNMLQHKAYCCRHSIEQRKVRDTLNCSGEVYVFTL